MSSTNDTYHHLPVQTQPKGILKKSPSPRFFDSQTDLQAAYPSNNTTIAKMHDHERNEIDIHQSDSRPVSTQFAHQHVKTNNSNVEIQSAESTITSIENQCQYQLSSTPLIKGHPSVGSSSTSQVSDDEHPKQERTRANSKKSYSRPFVNTNTLSSSGSFSDDADDDDDDDKARKAKRSVHEPKNGSTHSNKHRSNDMQLGDFMRRYQHYGGIHLHASHDDNSKDSTITEYNMKHNGNDRHHSLSEKQTKSFVDKLTMENDTLSLLESVNAITLTSKVTSPLQLLFDIACTNEFDRPTKIDRIRQYVEEQIGISAFLTIYKLLKSSKIPVDTKQKPFCNYANFIPHLCCLIMLESEQQKSRF